MDLTLTQWIQIIGLTIGNLILWPMAIRMWKKEIKAILNGDHS